MLSYEEYEVLMESLLILEDFARSPEFEKSIIYSISFSLSAWRRGYRSRGTTKEYIKNTHFSTYKKNKIKNEIT